MISRKPVRRLLLTSSLVLIPAFASLSTRTPHKTFKHAEGLGQRTAKTSKDIDNYRAQLDKTERALSSVSGSEGADLKKKYESFSKEVKRLEEAQKHTTSDINEMQAAAARYFSSWDQSIAQISNPQLKQASVDRRLKVMKDHDELAAKLSDVGRELQPFMNNLHELQTFLGTNLSPENVSNAHEMIEKSQTDARSLQEKIEPVQVMLRHFLSEAP